MSRPELQSAVSFDPTFDEASLRGWRRSAGLANFESATTAVNQIAELGIPSDLLVAFWKQLADQLHASDAPDECLRLVTGVLARTRSPQSMVVLFQRDPTSLASLFEAFAIGPQIADVLIDDPEAFELIRITDGKLLEAYSLRDEILSEVATARSIQQVSKSLLRFRNRESARIAFGLLARNVAPDESFRKLAALADAILRAAFDVAKRYTMEKLGRPMLPSGYGARSSLLAFRQLGAQQLGFESEIALMILAETTGRTDHSRLIPNTEFFDRFVRNFREVLAADEKDEAVYRVQFVKPDPVQSTSDVVDSTLAFQHYDLRGRTWERQEFVQSRSIAGDEAFGQGLLDRLQPWVYRRYLGDPDIAGLGANQRKLQRRLAAEANHRVNAGDARQAAEDIEQMVLFLQLLHGHEYPATRVGNTLEAIQRLAEHHLLRQSESAVLAESYTLFRRSDAKRKLQSTSTASYQSVEDRRKLAEAIEVSMRVINVRLVESFPGSQSITDETDLILEPKPEPFWVDQLLTAHGFKNPVLAYQHLMEMAEEEVAILSTRKCRYYLSRIAAPLLQAIGSTPDPDVTLSNLAKMSASLGGKGVLWELLAGNQPTMQLIVRLSATSDYLVGLISQSPGMIDELIDSLLLNHLPRRDELEYMLAELCRQTDDIDRNLLSFKNSLHLRVGVRDILGKDSLIDTHRALSDIVEVCVQRMLKDEYATLVSQYGKPCNSSGLPVAHTLVGLGKLGGQEPNYHSDFSVILLFEDEGLTVHDRTVRSAETTTCRHFFEQLAQRLMRRCNRNVYAGKLFELDVRFGPLGNSGVLAMHLNTFVEYFQGPLASTLERLSLCKARPIAGNSEFASKAMRQFSNIIRQSAFEDSDRRAVVAYRNAMRQNASVDNIKRGEGGTLDVECFVQSLQICYAQQYPEILVPGTLEALRLLGQFRILTPDEAKVLHEGYLALREIESGLRLMNAVARHDLPRSQDSLNTLAFLIGWESGEKIRTRVQEILAFNRTVLTKFFQT
jgi:[glutamine synthetase] adenylyltransferase / [glutamine synthetase]-adenylyl-L-tyrosine phosphorylase